MNKAQEQVANTVARHFKRQWRLMPRNGPVGLFEADMRILVDDLVNIYYQQNNLFDEDAFRAITEGPHAL